MRYFGKCFLMGAIAGGVLWLVGWLVLAGTRLVNIPSQWAWAGLLAGLAVVWISRFPDHFRAASVRTIKYFKKVPSNSPEGDWSYGRAFGIGAGILLFHAALIVLLVNQLNPHGDVHVLKQIVRWAFVISGVVLCIVWPKWLKRIEGRISFMLAILGLVGLDRLLS